MILLVRRNEDDELEVDDADLGRDGEQQILWRLDPATLPDAVFVAKKPKPLTWLKEPPWYVFNEPVVGANGRELSLLDNHIGTLTEGHFGYLLKVVAPAPDGGTRHYSTGTPLTRGDPRTTTHPIIINH